MILKLEMRIKIGEDYNPYDRLVFSDEFQKSLKAAANEKLKKHKNCSFLSSKSEISKEQEGGELDT